MITATARRREGYTHDVEMDTHKIVADEPKDAGGADEGPSPTRLLAASLASCTAITVAMYAGRKEWDIDGLEVAVDFAGSPKGTDAAEFVIHLRYPEGIDEERINKIRSIAAKCPVHRTLTGKVVIEMLDEFAVDRTDAEKDSDAEESSA